MMLSRVLLAQGHAWLQRVRSEFAYGAFTCFVGGVRTRARVGQPIRWEVGASQNYLIEKSSRYKARLGAHANIFACMSWNRVHDRGGRVDSYILRLSVSSLEHSAT